MKNNGVEMFEFKQHGDDRGHLVVVEGQTDIPFDIKRIFYIYGSDSKMIRGCHANRNSQFVLMNVQGSSTIKVTNGIQEETYQLDKPYKGVYIPAMLWKEMYDFSPDSVLLCLASHPYDAGEYIRDYETYLEEMRG